MGHSSTVVGRRQCILAVRSYRRRRPAARCLPSADLLIFFTSGTAAIRVDGVNAQVAAGSILSVGAGRELTFNAGSEVEATVLYLAPEIVREEPTWLRKDHPLTFQMYRALVLGSPFSCVSVGRAGVRALAPKLAVLESHSHYSGHDFLSIAAAAGIANSISLTAENADLAEPPGDASDRQPNAVVASALKALRERPQLPWTAQSLATAARISTSQLSRLFRRELGISDAPRVSWRLGYLEPAPIGTCSEA